MSELNSELRVKLRTKNVQRSKRSIQSKWSIQSNALERSFNNALNSFHSSADFSKFSSSGNAEKYILCGIHIDSVKVSYQNNHTVGCKLVFGKF